MTKQEKVAAWLKSLGYSRPPGAEDIWHKEGAPWVSDEQATFFYDVVEESKNKAKADAYDDARDWLEDNLTSKKDVASICATRSAVLRGEMEVPKSRFAPPQTERTI